MMNIAEMKTTHVADQLEGQLDSVPALVIALHPELERVGEVAPLVDLLQEGRDYVSRNRPDFSKNGHAGKSLNDPGISRSPIIFQQDNDDSLRIRAHSTRTTVEIVGRALQSEYLLSQDDVNAGVPIILNKSVVLLLKRIPLGDARVHTESLLKGISADAEALRRKLRHIADFDFPVMIRGAAGTGKEQVAFCIHQQSERADKPFVSANLAAIHDAVAEEELFGCQSEQRITLGYFGQAQGGTLLLEDIEDASTRVQELLFNAITSGYYVPAGGDEQVAVDCRFIASSVHDACPCEKGSKLWQLSNQMAAYQLFLSPLVERAEDISLLFLHFVHEQWQKLYPHRRFESVVPADLIGQLLTFHWPGNVRQLRNVARQVVIDSRDQEKLQLDPQLLSILQPRIDAGHSPAPQNNGQRKPNSIGRDELLEALQANRFELQATARQLRISRASVYQLIQRYNGVNTAQDLSEDTLRDSYQKHAGDTEKMMWELRVSQIGLRRRLKAMGYDI